MKGRILKVLGVLFLGSAILVGLSLLYLRETCGGAYVTRYISPTHPDYVLELYINEPWIGSPLFSLYVVDLGQRHFLGDFDWGGENSTWSPWAGDIAWTSDGKIVFCREITSHACRSAYIFGEHEVLIKNGLPKTNGLKPARVVDEAFFTSFLHEHGGEAPAITSWQEDPGSFVWRDLLPSRNK